MESWTSKTNGFGILLISLGLSACGPSSFQVNQLSSQFPSQENGLATPAPGEGDFDPTPVLPTPAPTPPPSNPPSSSKTYPLLWETRSEGKTWSTFVFNLFKNELATTFLPGTSDVTGFCPRYHTLTNDQRVNFWGLLVSAMTKYESNFSPTMRYKESTMGVDPVTGQHVYSEGLLQLSYQDVQWAKFCEFDWNKDKSLSPTDPRKTIFNPQKNLSCGIKILARQIQRKNKIAVTGKEGAYWAVLIPGGKYTKLAEIQALTKKMPGCL